jgi:myosin heavy subunit
MPPKKASATGAAALQPLDPNQETLSLREARSQKRKATSPTLQEDDLDQEIRNMEMLHQQVQRKKEKMARLADLQRQIDEASEEVCHLVRDEQNQSPSTESFIKRASSTRMTGMRISIMEILLLMMLLLCQQNCRLQLGPRLTSHPSSPCMTDTQIRSNF